MSIVTGSLAGHKVVIVVFLNLSQFLYHAQAPK